MAGYADLSSVKRQLTIKTGVVKRYVSPPPRSRIVDSDGFVGV